MSHNNYDKPFYVDVGPITTAIRCQTNDDALILHDYVHGGHSLIDTANNMCGRMNEEVDKFVAAKDEEIARLRECLRLSSNAMEIVVQWLGKYPAWQECLKNEVARNRKAMEMIGGCEVKNCYKEPTTGIVHIKMPIFGGGEYTLCGDAFDRPSTEDGEAVMVDSDEVCNCEGWMQIAESLLPVLKKELKRVAKAREEIGVRELLNAQKAWEVVK